MSQERLVSVRSKWYSIPASIGVIIVLSLVGGIAYALVRATVNHLPLPTSLLLILVGLGGVVILLFGTLFFVAPRRVDISSETLTVWRGVSKTTVKWKNLIPPEYPLHMGIVVFEGDQGKGKPRLQLPVRRNQAQAILSHPSCPSFGLNREIWKSLNMEPSGRDSSNPH